MALRKLGTGTTNSQGIAKLEYDADGNPINHSYTGVGAGKIQIIARTTGLESVPVDVYDCAFLDVAIGSRNAGWTNASAYTVTSDSTGTTLSREGGSSIHLSKTNTTFSDDFEAVFELKSSANATFGVVDTSSNDNRSFKTVSVSDFNQFKLRLQNGVLTAYQYLDGDWSELTLNGNNATLTGSLKFFFQLANVSGTATLTYKNLKIYPV